MTGRALAGLLVTALLALSLCGCGGTAKSTTRQKTYPYYLAFSQPIFLSAAD